VNVHNAQTDYINKKQIHKQLNANGNLFISQLGIIWNCNPILYTRNPR